jgi:hypothetical protein
MSTPEEIGSFSVELRPDGILDVRIRNADEVDLNLAKKIIKVMGEKCADKKRPTLITSENFSAPNAEARAYLAKLESNPYSSCSAYIAKTLAEKLMTNAYIRFNKPQRPTRMFTNENKAIEWLKTFL